MYSFLLKFYLAHRPYSNQLNDMLIPHGVSSSQWGLIRYLFENGPATFSDVVAYWQVEKPTVTPLAQKLVERELIFILPGADKRQKVMHLSEKGIEMYKKIRLDLDLMQAELMEGIPQEEIEIAERLFDKLHANLRKRG